MKPENPQQVASGVDDKTKTRKRDKRDKKDRRKQPSTMGSIFNTFLFLLAFEIGLYGCVFHQVSQNNIEGIFWTALGMACFLGIVQLIFILFVQNVSKKDVKSKSIKRLLIIGILIIPIVIFVASCVFTVGVTEILLNLTSIDSYLIPTNWNSNEAHLLYSRTVFFLISSVCCLKLFLAQLEQLCIRFVHKKLSHVVFMIEFQDSTVPVQTVGGQNEVQAAYVMGGTGVGHDNNNNNDHDHHPTQLLNQGHLQTQSHPTYTVLIMIASEIALAILQVLSANDGVFLSSFLPIFGLTCCALGVMVCYLILMNDWGSEDFSSLVSIWVSVPLTILLINTWCFSIQLIEFFMSTQGVWMLNGMFTQVSGVKLALLICMTVFYFFIVVSGIYGTKTLLEMIQIADGKEKERTSSFILLKSESQKVVPSNPQNNTNVVVTTTTTTQAIQPGSVAAMVAAHNNNNQPTAQKVGSNQ